MSLFHRFFRILFAVVLLWMASAQGYSQGVTTATLEGTVTDSSGKPISGATITVLHVSSGTKVTATTRPNGQYNISGLRVGGPYTVSVKGGGSEPDERQDLFLTLDQPAEVNFLPGYDVVALENFVVSSDSDKIFGLGRMSTSSDYTAREIALIPTVRRDVQDIANLDPRVSLTPNTSTGEFSISVQGQNSRYNSFLVDGMQSNDPFGLNANGFSSLRSPVPWDSIAAFNIDLSPYDVTHSGFTGALINVVTKSGTNTLHGSVYGFYTAKEFRAANPGKGDTDPSKGVREPLEERTFGGTFGGPIVKGKLFFFLAFDDFRQSSAPLNGQVFVPDAAAVSAIADAAKSYGYDAGQLSSNILAVSRQRTFLAKLDWNITDLQRATFTYRKVESSAPNFADFNGSTFTSFSNHWYLANRMSNNYSAALNSTWTSDFQTDSGLAYITYNGTATPYGASFPEVYVNGVTGLRLDTGAAVSNGQVDLGTNASYQLNQLNTKDFNGHLYNQYSWFDHTFKFGGDFDRTHYYDAFAQYYFGRYAFASPAAFAAGSANYLRYQQASPGYTIGQSFADYTLTNFGLILQDSWKPNTALTVSGGLRLDYPSLSSKPPFLPNFYNTFGYRNDATGSGNYTLAPRVGFSYDLPSKRKTELRGGVGLFQGTNPAVWIANAFDTFGGLSSVTKPSNSASSSSTVTPSPAIVFNPNPSYVQTLAPPGVPAAVVNTIDPQFRTPVTWKANLAIDHTLPWWGLIATAEIDATMTESAIFLQSLNNKPDGFMPDGRIKYNGNIHPAFSSVLNMRNTHLGESEAYTVLIQRPLKNHWSASLAYTRTYATEVQPLTSSVAASNYSYRASINPNEEIAYRSAYLTPDKWVATASREFEFFTRANTTTRISAAFRAQTGHAYSWVFFGDANGDQISGNDAFYVPTGPNDPKVVWANATERDAFFAFLKTTDLRKFAGRIAAPNTSYNPWQETLDLHIEQEIPLYHNLRVSLYLDCMNFANLLNRKWGIVEGLDFNTSYNGYNRAVASTTVNAAGQYVYTFNSSTLGGQPVFTDLSRWQIQSGIKFQF